MWLCGPSAVGQTTVGWEIFSQLTRAGIETGYADIDQLGRCYPEAASDPGRHQMKAQNLGSVAANFRAANARCLLLVKDIATGKSYGGPIDASLAGQIAWAFRPPLRFAQVHTARFDGDAEFSQDCDAPYCYQHWHLSGTGYGYCPYGHGKDLDPHWSPLTDT